MLHHRKRFNFGRLVHSEIMQMARSTDMERKIIFPNLIFQIIAFEFDVSVHPADGAPLGYPKRVTLDPKAGRGSGDEKEGEEPDLEGDVDRALKSLCTIKSRLARGEYPGYPRNTSTRRAREAGDSDEYHAHFEWDD